MAPAGAPVAWALSKEARTAGQMPGVTPAQIMAEAARQPEGGFSYRNATVIDVDGVAGGALIAGNTATANPDGEYVAFGDSFVANPGANMPAPFAMPPTVHPSPC